MELNWEKSGDFLMRMFAPAVELFAQELEFDVDECYESAEHWEWLKKTSAHLLAQENYEEYVKDILTKHLAIWEARKGDPAALQKVAGATEAFLKKMTRTARIRIRGFARAASILRSCAIGFRKSMAVTRSRSRGPMLWA